MVIYKFGELLFAMHGLTTVLETRCVVNTEEMSFDCYAFHIQIHVTIVLLPFTLQMLPFHALPCWATTSPCRATRLLYPTELLVLWYFHPSTSALQSGTSRRIMVVSVAVIARQNSRAVEISCPDLTRLSAFF